MTLQSGEHPAVGGRTQPLLLSGGSKLRRRPLVCHLPPSCPDSSPRLPRMCAAQCSRTWCSRRTSAPGPAARRSARPPRWQAGRASRVRARTSPSRQRPACGQAAPARAVRHGRAEWRGLGGGSARSTEDRPEGACQACATALPGLHHLMSGVQPAAARRPGLLQSQRQPKGAGGQVSSAQAGSDGLFAVPALLERPESAQRLYC